MLGVALKVCICRGEGRGEVITSVKDANKNTVNIMVFVISNCDMFQASNGGEVNIT